VTDRVDLDELERLHKAATPGPWGWESGGDKQNDAFLGTFFNENDEQIGGYVEVEKFDEKRGFYNSAERDELIAENCGHANYANFASIAANHNALPGLIAELREARADNAAMAQYHGGHLPTCGGMDEVERCCECGYLQGEAYRALYDELREARALLWEIHDSVPASHDDEDQMVIRHARALNAIRAHLAKHTKKEAADAE
jgi:hypothetical protein